MFRFFQLFQQRIYFLLGSLDSLESKLEKMQQFCNIDRKDYLDVIYKDEITPEITPDLIFALMMTIFLIVVIRKAISHTKSIAKCINPDDITVRFKWELTIKN